MASRIYTAHQIQEMAVKYQAGASLPQLAREYGGAHVTVRHVLRREGVVMRRPGRASWRRFTPEQQAEIAERWQAGESQSKIALRFGTTQAVISKMLVFQGIEPVQRRGSGRGPVHGSWKGGVTYVAGYRFVKIPPYDDMACMRNAQGYVPEHRLVMARHLGRPLLPDETVHHKRGKADNAIGNLELWSGAHPKGQRVDDIVEWAAEMLQRYAPERLA